MYDELVKELRVAGDFVSLSRYQRDLMRKAADAIEELSKPRWISVTERLPEEGQYVLVSYISISGTTRTVSFWFLDDRNKVRWGGENELLVTHWMPLPEPPKEEA